MPTTTQTQARRRNGRRATARWITLARANRERPSDTRPRAIPLHLAALDEFRLPSLCRVIDPKTGAVVRRLDPFTREPVA